MWVRGQLSCVFGVLIVEFWWEIHSVLAFDQKPGAPFLWLETFGRKDLGYDTLFATSIRNVMSVLVPRSQRFHVAGRQPSHAAGRRYFVCAVHSVFSRLQKTGGWSLAPFGRIYLGYANWLATSMLFLLTLRKMMPRYRFDLALMSL